MHVLKRRSGVAQSKDGKRAGRGAWASVGVYLTFRAELMPGRETAERTFAVTSMLTNGRVELQGLAGEHAESEFETRR
jgi:hypothetical protein